MRKKKLIQYTAFFMALNIFFEVVSPTLAMALTNGPLQPEFVGFTPANSSEMVDLFSGDFKYNIPLMDVDGYPLNLSYKAGDNMETEASWVGFGWSMNPGVLNRMVKGLPDDFNGDVMKSETHMKPHAAMGVGFQFSSYLGFNLEYKITGTGDDLKISAGGQVGVNAALVLTYNNYKGFGIEGQLDGNATLSAQVGELGGMIGGGVGMTLSSQDGGTLSYQHSKGIIIGDYSASVGEATSINTRTGAMNKTYFGSQSVSYESAYSVGFSTSHTLPSGSVAYSPRIANDYTGSGFGLSIKAGLWGCAQIPLPSPLPVLKLKGGLLAGYKGFYNKSTLLTTTKNSAAYGYMYLENANDRSLMDFNRFKDGPVSEEVPNGPLANKTYDNYSAVAQGMSSTFRPFRSDIGIVHDTYNTNNSSNSPYSTEFSALVFVHLMIDVMTTVNFSYSGNWNTLINNSVKFQDRDISQLANRYYEKAYFKQFGEMAARNSAFDNSLGGENAVKPQLKKIADGFDAVTSGGLSGAPRTKRDIRGTNIGYLTAKQADQYGFEKQLDFYDINTAGHSINASTRMVNEVTSNVSRLNFKNGSDVSAHFSEINITNTNGSRYVYGIPAYNLYKKKVMFNASDRTESAYQANGYPGTSYAQNPLKKSNSYQLVEYSPSSDLTTNKRGYENLYQSDETPAYANSFLLTNILSTDYVDVTGDGPSYDDLGTFTKFNYSKTADYQWREPYGAPSWASMGLSGLGTKGSLSGVINQANFDKGLIADELDDKGFYEYGQRENYYLQSIETKNYVAFFECSPRSDFMGVASEDGTSAGATAYKLDQVKLYSKSEIIANGMAAAVPIKTIHFDYDYSLCPNTFNSSATSHGKLTLKKVYFTYGSSQKAALSPYVFYYGDNNHDGTTDTYGNPDYNNKAMDRWGSYKPNATGSGVASDETPDVGTAGILNNIEFPYSEQDEDLSNQYAVAWNLTKIVTPSNSSIEITYEADDYAYVQNQQAGQMLIINNAVNDVTTNDNVAGYSSNNNLFDANYLIIDLSKLNTGIPTSMPLATANNFVKRTLFKTNTDLYYKCFMKLAGPANSFGLKKNYYDYVPGYGTIENAGLYSGVNNNYTKGGITYYKYAYVKLKKEIAYASTMVNPISLASWDYMRSFLPRIAYPGSEPANMGDNSHKPVKQLANALIGLGVALADFATGIAGRPNYRFYFRNFCKEMDYSKSFVRAYVPYKKKKGGGYRIKQILTKDSWNDMTNNTSTGNSEKGSVYGQSFDYTTLDTDNKTVISSGVAYYEPLLGGDEISLRKPIKFELDKKMAPNDHLFQEEPYGEMLFPGGMVGYSKVTVTPLADQSVTNLYSIGKSVFEFYTAKDYPIIESRTALEKQLYQNDLIQDFTVVTKAYKILHATQGHVLKFNDMHGKLKAINTYGQDNLNAPISGASYTYKDAPYGSGSRQLITTAKTISEANVITDEQIARDIDVTVDNRSNLNESTTAGNDFLMELSLCSNIANIHNNTIYGYEKTGLQTSVATKIVQQYGILSKSETFDTKSRATTTNLLWDRNTGNVLLSMITNNYDAPVYNFNYPAYWAYPKMGNEFKREGIVVQVLPNTIWSLSSGTLLRATLSNPEVLALGDEVVVYDSNVSNPIVNGKRYWVCFDYNSPTASTYNYALIDADGFILNTSNVSGLNASNTYYIKVVRAAERNQLTESMGSTAALKVGPLSGSNFALTQNVISAHAQTWCSGWNAYIKDPNTINQQNSCLFEGFGVTPLVNYNRFNPYVAGLLGNWRPEGFYVYNVNRNYNAAPNTKTDGAMSSFTPYWQFANGINVFARNNSATFSDYTTTNANNSWVLSNENTVYSPYGYLMENVDAIGVPHAQRFGYNNTLPILSASNARVREVGFESFEDYLLYYGALNSCRLVSNDQLDFYNQINLSSTTAKPYIVTTTAHTGRSALYFSTAGNNVTLEHRINKSGQVVDEGNPSKLEGFTVCGNDAGLNKMNLSPGKYIASFWVRGNTAVLNYSPLLTFNVEVQNGPGGATSTLSSTVKRSGIINGWQKFDYEFTVISGYATDSFVRFKFNAVNPFYLDDFRVQPYNSNMVCTVYDPYQMRVWAQLDDNNYATIMEYDNEGILVRKKRETLKGIYTLQETRQATVKHN